MVPLLGLLPVLVAVVLASEGRLGGQPSAPAPARTSAPTVVAIGQVQTAQNGPAAAAQAQAPGQSAAAQPAGAANSAQPAAPVATGATTATAGTQGSGSPATAATPPTAATGVAAAATAPPRSPTSGAGLFRAYSVQPGDTLKFVAQMYGVSLASVAQASGVRNADYLRVGQVLTIPVEPGWLYRVQSGETLDQIAARTGVASQLIESASKLTSDSVGPGDVILIPDQLAAAAGK